MRLLLDTHTCLWLDGSPEPPSPAALAACEEPTNELYLSVVSAWGIQIKHQIRIWSRITSRIAEAVVSYGVNSGSRSAAWTDMQPRSNGRCSDSSSGCRRRIAVGM